MYKCVIWGLGSDYDAYFSGIKLQECLHKIQVIGVTSNQKIYKNLDEYKFIEKNELLTVEFDILIIASLHKFEVIKKEANSLGIEDEKIVNIKIFSLPNLNIDKYFQLKKSKVTIFSNNCWGGLTYNRLGMEFYSPFINMYESESDYLKIITNPKEYMEYPLQLDQMKYNRTLKMDYPSCSLNDVILNCNHYSSFELANQKWMERKEKINWNNLFVMMYTEDMEIAKKFVDLPYEKKICFVPFETKEEALFHIDYRNTDEMKQLSFWSIINGIAIGTYKYYDVVDLLCGEKNKKRIK